MNDMTEPNFDLLVIGGGSGGVRCARTAARLGARVACVEGRFWGGTCVNVGCVPKKLYVIASEFGDAHLQAQGFGWNALPWELDWTQLHNKVNAEVNRLSGIYDKLLDNAGVTRLWGQARLLGPNAVEVNGQRFTARNIVIATGAKPVIPDIPGKELALDSDGFFAIQEKPRSAIVIGGGYIAVELAGVLAGTGAATSLLYRGECVLRGFDNDVRTHVQTCMKNRGVNVLTHTQVASLRMRDGQREVLLKSGETLLADVVIFATGRCTNVDGLNLDKVGITLNERGGIPVDQHYQTCVPGIYAVGDVLQKKQLTPVALAEGMYVAQHLFGKTPPQPLNYDCIATAVFSQPPVACVGLTEQECMQRGENFRIYQSRFTPMTHAFESAPDKVLLKMLVDDASDKVLGIHIVGENAAEIMQGFAVAIQCGATKEQLDSTIGIHPTMAEELVTMREVSARVDPSVLT